MLGGSWETMVKDALAQVKTLIDDGTRFVLSTHVAPDGDGIGSQLALARVIGRLGKTVHIINADPYPSNFQFLLNGI